MIFTKGKTAFLLASVIGVLPVNAVLALEVKGLYEIELIARSQSPEDRETAIKQALYGVLSRVIVAEDISKIPAVQQMLSGAMHYVKQFQYSLIAANEYSDSDARLIRVEFDQDQLLEVMRASHVGYGVKFGRKPWFGWSWTKRASGSFIILMSCPISKTH